MDKLETTSTAPSAVATVATAEGAIVPGGSGDPMHVFDENKLLMALSPDDFASIRRGPDGFLCISDAISMFTECSDNCARMKWSQVAPKFGQSNIAKNKSGPEWHSGGELQLPVKYFAFPYRKTRADGGVLAPVRKVTEGERRAVPCTNFRGLLTILSQLDHPRCKKLRVEMANLATRASTGDEALEQALPVRRQEMPQELRDAMRAGLAGFDKGPADGALALQTALITQLQKLVEAKELALKDKEAIITQQEARLALGDLALKQQMTITRLQEENASKRRKLLIGAVPVLLSAEEENEVPENELRPAGSTCKGDPRWSRLMTEHARTFSEKLARSLTLHAKQVRERYLDEVVPTGNEEVEIDEGTTQSANEEALEALRQAVMEVLRPADPAVLTRFQTIHGTRTYSEVARIMCARLPRCNLNSTAIPLAHWFLYLVQKNAWGHGEDLELESELEATMAGEVLGDDLYLYTLDEPHGLVRVGTPEFELRTKKLELARGGDSEAQEFFEARGLPAKYLLRSGS